MNAIKIELRNCCYGIRSHERVFLRRPRLEFYDRVEDPDEVRNLAQDPACQEEVARYLEKIRLFQEITDDPRKLYQDYEHVNQLVNAL